MKFDFYLFDLDGTLFHLGNIGVYVDQILKETFRRLEASNPPKGNEKYKLWSPEVDFFDVLKEWGVTEPQNFWKFFDEIDFDKRKILITKKEAFLYISILHVLQ